MNPVQPARGPGKWLLATGLILAVILFYASGLYHRFSWQQVHEQLTVWQNDADQHPVTAVLVFVAVYVLVTLLSLPFAAMLTLIAGALFGRGLGTVVVSVASTTGAVGAFLISRYLLRGWVQARFGKRLAWINTGLERDGGVYLLTLRLVPMIPFAAVNLGMGLTRMPVVRYALISWAGMLPATILYVNAGTAIGQIDSPAQVLSPPVLGSLALLGLLPLVLRGLLTRRDRGK